MPQVQGRLRTVHAPQELLAALPPREVSATTYAATGLMIANNMTIKIKVWPRPWLAAYMGATCSADGSLQHARCMSLCLEGDVTRHTHTWLCT